MQADDVGRLASPLTEQLGQAPERDGFAAWWRDNWPEATPQSTSFAEAERCARLAFGAAVAAERKRWCDLLAELCWASDQLFQGTDEARPEYERFNAAHIAAMKALGA